MGITVEICCGSYGDALRAFEGGARRIELNGALELGGLTPPAASLILTKRDTGLKVIAMDRPRAAGFCYSDEEFLSMLTDGRILLEQGADGIAFGCLRADRSIDGERVKRMVCLIKEKGGEAVFHRAFDCSSDLMEAAGQLAKLGVDRILTSGGRRSAGEGWAVIRDLQTEFTGKIEILAGCGIHPENAAGLIDRTGVRQIHSSCKKTLFDPTTSGGEVSYGFYPPPFENGYPGVSKEEVRRLVTAIAGQT